MIEELKAIREELYQSNRKLRTADELSRSGYMKEDVMVTVMGGIWRSNAALALLDKLIATQETK